jgi:hypothetical protein
VTKWKKFLKPYYPIFLSASASNNYAGLGSKRGLRNAFCDSDIHFTHNLIGALWFSRIFVPLLLGKYDLLRVICEMPIAHI